MRKEAMSGQGIARVADFIRDAFSGSSIGQGFDEKGRFKMNAKKTLTALSVFSLALTGLSQITSANVVGFLGAGTTNENYTMVAGCFGKVGADKQYTLADLSVNGYDPSYTQGILWKGGCTKGAFELDVLKNDGNPSAMYFWIDCTTGTKTSSKTFDPGWYKYVDSDYVKMTAEEVAAVKIKAGNGFWIAGSGYNLVVPSPLTEEKDAE